MKIDIIVIFRLIFFLNILRDLIRLLDASEALGAYIYAFYWHYNGCSKCHNDMVKIFKGINFFSLGARAVKSGEALYSKIVSISGIVLLTKHFRLLFCV